MNFMTLFPQMLVLLLLLFIGAVCAKTGMIGAKENAWLSKFTLAVPQTFMILNSSLNMEERVSAFTILKVIGCGLLLYAVLVGIGFIVGLVFKKAPPDRRKIYQFMTIFGNVGFMGIPVIRVIFGVEGVFYNALLSVPHNILAFTYGVYLISGGKGEKVTWKNLLSPALAATCISIFIILLNVSFPAPVEETIERMGEAVVPLSMIVVGSSLGSRKIKEVFGDWRAYIFAPIRLLMVPFCVSFVLRFFVHDPVIYGTAVVMAAMPAAAITAMFSLRYGVDESFPSKCILVSTILSVFSVPLVCSVLL